MRVRNLVGGVLLLAACEGPEAFRPGQAIGQPSGTGGTGNLPVMTSGSGGAGTGGALPSDGTAGTFAVPGAAGTSGGAAGTTGVAGTGVAGTGAAGTGSAGSVGPSAGGAGGSSNRDGGAPGGAGTSAPRDAAPEVVVPTTPYPPAGLKPMASVTAAGNADAPANAVDGDIKTRWATGRNQTGNESFLLDLGASKSVSRVVLDNTTHPNDFPVAYTLEVSINGTAFTNPTMGKGAAVTDIQLPRVMARYVRIRQTGMTPAPNGAWWSIDEIKVYP